MRQRISRRTTGIPRSGATADATGKLLTNLHLIGWHRSIDERAPMDRTGGAVPWWPYSAISWVDSVLTGTEHVLEFGSGSSTAWLAARAQTVTSVEHSAEWAERAALGLSANATILHRPAVATTVDYISVVEEVGPRDVYIVDGAARTACLQAIAKKLSGRELVLLDDSDRPEYLSGIEAIQSVGFGRIDFAGFGPARSAPSTSSAFLKDFNRWCAPRASPTNLVKLFGNP